jgi:phosphatidylserine/phosphatidylglycerophosphate/cardiolipin synthase-like enzyme
MSRAGAIGRPLQIWKASATRGRAWLALALAAVALATAGCPKPVETRYLSQETRDTGRISEDTLRVNSSTPRLQIQRAAVVVDNDTAFERKLALIEGATRQLDLAYFIYADDYSSAVLTDALVRAARRGVQVRLLLDYFRNYRDLDYYAMMERYGNTGAGRLEVRFFNRPTVHVIKDAVFLTLGCQQVTPGGALAGCGEAKFAQIDRWFDEARANATPGTSDPGLNFNTGGSGLLLSGLYGRNLDVLVSAITEGQGLIGDEPARERKPVTARAVDQAIEGAKVYWRARASNPRRFQQLAARMKVDLAFALYGDKLGALRDMLTAYFPIERQAGRREAVRDWDYLTAFLHHKLLLADGRAFQLGGRNIEDPYHVGPTPLVTRYRFRDTDVHVELASGGEALTRTFDRLWDFRSMVATLDDIRQHAPHDSLMAIEHSAKACKDGAEHAAGPADVACQTREMAAHADASQRIEERYRSLQDKLARFRQEYRPAEPADRIPDFPVDASADVFYVENLPFEGGRPGAPSERLYGPRPGLEGESGKYIHNLWVSGLRQACRLATAERPQRVVIHNAYFLLPSNLLGEIGRMVRGDIACPHVDVVVLTNSPETTDLSVINLVGRYALKAMVDQALQRRDPARGARFAYYEYLKEDSGPGRSLHSKVMVLGPDVFVGSANADVRSYMLDSNNGLYVKGAPRLVATYLEWVDAILQDRRLVADRTSYFVETSRARLLADDWPRIASTIRQLAGPDVDSTVPVDHVALRLSAMLDTAYELCAEIVRGGRGQAEAARRFDALFKLL